MLRFSPALRRLPGIGGRTVEGRRKPVKNYVVMAHSLWYGRFATWGWVMADYFLGEYASDRRPSSRARVVNAAREARAGYCQISLDGQGVRRVLLRSGGPSSPAVGGAFFRKETAARAFAQDVMEVVNLRRRGDAA